MNPNMPRTPFSTPLSGSAKEAELRIRNIFSGPKKRPPALFLALMFSVCIFCGNIVSCRLVEAEIPPEGSQVQTDGDSPLTDGPSPLEEDWRRQMEDRLADMGDGSIVQLLHRDMDQAMEPDAFHSNEFWTWTDSTTVSLCALAGETQKEHVLVRLHSTGAWPNDLEYALYSPELWAYVLQHYHTDWEVDQEMLSRIRSRVDTLIERQCRETAERGTGYAVTGGEVTALKRLYTYNDLDFSPGTAYLYDLRIALTGADLTQIHMSGGEWVDDLGRLWNDYAVAYAAILEEDGEIVKVVFLAGDAISVWGYSEEGGDEFRRATEHILRTCADGEHR